MKFSILSIFSIICITSTRAKLNRKIELSKCQHETYWKTFQNLKEIFSKNYFLIYSVQDIPCSNTTKAASSATTRAPFPSTTQSHSPLQANLSKPSTKPTATQANRNTTTQRTRSTRAPFPSTSQSHPPLQASKSTSRSKSKHTTHCKVKGEAKHGNPSYCYAFQYDEDELDNAALDCCWISGSHSPINNSLTGFPLNVKLNEKDMYVAWPIYHIYCFFSI